MRRRTMLTLFVALLAAGMMLPASGEDALSQGLVVTESGTHVVDARSKLAWPRCVEGMQWNGKTCTGEPRLMTYGEATAWAASRAKADGVPWRLPRVTELRRWAARNGKAVSPAAELFPAAPLDWYWTMTASIETRSVNPYNYDNIRQGHSSGTQLGVQQGWAVNMATGEAEGDVSRRSRLVVRLVASQ
jgi:hypothetical protein